MLKLIDKVKECPWSKIKITIIMKLPKNHWCKRKASGIVEIVKGSFGTRDKDNNLEIEFEIVIILFCL